MTTSHTSDTSDTERSRNSARWRTAWAILAGIGSGSLFAVQGRINGELGKQLGDGLVAAVISFGGGLLLFVLLSPALPAMRRGFRALREALRGRRLAYWQCLGGVGGATLVAAQATSVGVLGVALFTVGVVAGQAVTGLVVDRIGLGPAGPQALTVLRVLGAVLTLAGVAISLSGGITVGGSLVLIVLPMVGGLGIAVQQAINGRVSVASGSALTAGMVNFGVGTAVLIVAAVIGVLGFYGLPAHYPANPVLYIGGLFGVVFITAAAALVHQLGVLLLGLCTVAGQIIGSVVLDLVLPAHGESLTLSTVLGAALTLVAVAVAAMPGRRSGRMAG